MKGCPSLQNQTDTILSIGDRSLSDVKKILSRSRLVQENGIEIEMVNQLFSPFSTFGCAKKIWNDDSNSPYSSHNIPLFE